jgi:hypothetical protein
MGRSGEPSRTRSARGRPDRQGYQAQGLQPPGFSAPNAPSLRGMTAVPLGSRHLPE